MKKYYKIIKIIRGDLELQIVQAIGFIRFKRNKKEIWMLTECSSHMAHIHLFYEPD